MKRKTKKAALRKRKTKKIKPAWWWTTIKQMGACGDGLARLPKVGRFTDAVRNATEDDIRWLLDELHMNPICAMRDAAGLFVPVTQSAFIWRAYIRMALREVHRMHVLEDRLKQRGGSTRVPYPAGYWSDL